MEGSESHDNSSYAPTSEVGLQQKKYDSISNEARQMLLRLIKEQGMSIKKAT